MKDLDDHLFDCVQRESMALARMRHDNLLSLHDFFMEDKYICLIIDLMDMSLLDYLNKFYERLTQNDKLNIFSKIVEGVHYCHT